MMDNRPIKFSKNVKLLRSSENFCKDKSQSVQDDEGVSDRLCPRSETPYVVSYNELSELGVGHLGEAGLGLFGDGCEDHGDVIAGVLVAGAGDYDSIAVDLRAIVR